jgi:hypothetical protein
LYREVLEEMGLKRATYAAEAAKTSCLFALVNMEMVVENSNVETSKIPTQTVFSPPLSMRLEVAR